MSVQGQSQKIQDCTKAELNNLSVNANVRECAQKYRKELGKQGCKGLEDHECYCDRPVSEHQFPREIGRKRLFLRIELTNTFTLAQEYMALVTGCIYLAEPDVQDELLRYLKVKTDRDRISVLNSMHLLTRQISPLQWYECDTLPASLNKTETVLTPESNDLIIKAKLPQNAKDGARPTMSTTRAAVMFVSLLVASTLLF